MRSKTSRQTILLSTVTVVAVLCALNMLVVKQFSTLMSQSLDGISYHPIYHLQKVSSSVFNLWYPSLPSLSVTAIVQVLIMCKLICEQYRCGFMVSGAQAACRSGHCRTKTELNMRNNVPKKLSRKILTGIH